MPEVTTTTAPKMQWIEMTEDRGQFKKGQRIEKEEGSAGVLIEAGIAKKCDAPVVDPLDEARKQMATLIKETAVATATELFKQTPGAKRAFRDVNDQDTGYELGTAQRMTLPAEVKRYGRLRNFKGADAEMRAYRFGTWCLSNYALNGRISDPERRAKLMGNVEKAQKLGIIMGKAIPLADDESVIQKALGQDIVSQKASNENSNVSSGFLVPDEFQDDLIDLREKYGVFRQNARIVPMASDTRTDPRRRSGVTAYPVGEDQAGTQSTKNWDRVRLTARKWMVLSKYSNELNEDAVLNIADDLAQEIAYAFAYTEDKCGFIGDGTSTYGGIVGLNNALKNLSTTAAYGDVLGLTIATGTGYTGGSYGAIVLGDFNKVVATLPEYADDNNVKWYVSRAFWGGVMQRLAMSAGGNRVSEIVEGARVKEFAGYPVQVAQVMPKVAAGYQVCALLGDMRLSSSLGTRRNTTISISDVALNSFEQDEMAVRGTERFDINNHDVGENTNTANPRDAVQGAMAGPMVALITPNA